MIFCKNRFSTLGSSSAKTIRASARGHAFRDHALKMVRLAGFRRLHPVVPDRATFGAAAEHKTHGDHAEKQCQSSEHGRPTHRHHHTPSSQAFSSCAERVSISTECILG